MYPNISLRYDRRSLITFLQPALAAGNTFIYKPSEKAPLGTLALGKLIKQVFPPGTINIVNGGGKTGQLLAAHMDIRQIAFTGSTTTGRKIQQAAASSNLKRVTLELGGKSPSVIFDDADMELAVAKYVLFEPEYERRGS